MIVVTPTGNSISVKVELVHSENALLLTEVRVEGRIGVAKLLHPEKV